MQSQKQGLAPSDIMGLEMGTYSAFCFNQAVWYLGTLIESEMDEASASKPSAEEQRARGARQRVLDRYLEPGNLKKQYADPAAFFQ